ncbi:uroporphyrinogen-III synthase [Thalassobacillus sp. C254]|uniref:uroporphyrinogen-III synthase n=1 Tax=Thalassobacillus sp. C254 TaxID=1225341 RepID=UPI0006D1320C|nr:uroporphyrinogen-III synthase [Thalassobacillus sp. C254]
MKPGFLAGKKVLVTRQQSQAAGFVRRIEEQGGKAEVLPLIRLERAERWQELIQEFHDLTKYSWIILTSANAVHFFFEAVSEAEAVLPAQCRFAVVGEKTKQALRKHGSEASFVPSKFIGEVLAEELSSFLDEDDRVLIPKSNKARTVVADTLRKQGVFVQEVPLYRNVAERASAPALKELIQGGEIDILTFASPSAVQAFTNLLEEDDWKQWVKEVPVVCIGPVTKAEAERKGFSFIYTALHYTVDGMMEAMREIKGVK